MLSSSEFHSDLKALIISTLEVGVVGLKLEREVKVEVINALLSEPDSTFSWIALEPALVRFFIEQEGKDSFNVHAQTSLLLSCACVRCLTPVSHRIGLDFSIRMLEKTGEEEEFPQEISFESDVSVQEGEYPVGYFSRRSIDLGLILREQIFLEIPDYPKCGGDRAVSAVVCAPLDSVSTSSQKSNNPFIKLFKKTN